MPQNNAAVGQSSDPSTLAPRIQSASHGALNAHTTSNAEKRIVNDPRDTGE